MNDFWALLENIPFYQNIMGKIEQQRAGVKGVAGWSIIPKAFTYSASFTATTGPAAGVGATGTVNVGIQADSDFVILAQSVWTYVNDGTIYTQATQELPNVDIMLIDTGSANQYYDNPVPIPAIFGTGQFPWVLPQPIYLVG